MNQEAGIPARDAIRKFLVLYRYLRHYGRHLQCEGVRGRDLSTLRYLHEEGPLTIGQISDYLFINVSSTSELISRLEEAGYVARHRSKTDSRVVFVELTPDGQQLSEETPTGGFPLLRERMKTLPPERLALINDALSELIQVMEIEVHDFK